MDKILKKYLVAGETAERCGLILNTRKVIEVKNISETPEKGFEISPEDMVKYEDKLKATWHTHPGENSNLSEKDYMGFLMWPKLLHYIVGIDKVSCYKVEDGIVINVD